MPTKLDVARAKEKLANALNERFATKRYSTTASVESVSRSVAGRSVASTMTIDGMSGVKVQPMGADIGVGDRVLVENVGSPAAPDWRIAGFMAGMPTETLRVVGNSYDGNEIIGEGGIWVTDGCVVVGGRRYSDGTFFDERTVICGDGIRGWAGPDGTLLSFLLANDDYEYVEDNVTYNFHAGDFQAGFKAYGHLLVDSQSETLSWMVKDTTLIESMMIGDDPFTRIGGLLRASDYAIGEGVEIGRQPGGAYGLWVRNAYNVPLVIMRAGLEGDPYKAYVLIGPPDPYPNLTVTTASDGTPTLSIDGGTLKANTVVANSLNVDTLSAITADMGTLTAGEIRVGDSGEPGNDYTGLRLFKDGAIYRFEGQNAGTVQAYFDSDGKFYAAGGNFKVDTDGVTAGSGNDIVRIDPTQATYFLWLGNATAASAPFRVTKAGALTATSATITGSITATTGTIGGWTVSASDLSNGNIKLQSTAERILLGSATAPMTGVGIFLGLDGADYEFRAGDPAADYIHWDGSNLDISGNTVSATDGSGILQLDGANIQANTVTTGKLTVGFSPNLLKAKYTDFQSFANGDNVGGAVYNGTATCDTSDFYIGDRCLKMVASSANNYVLLADNWTDYNIRLEPSTKYIVSFYAKAASGTPQVGGYIYTDTPASLTIGTTNITTSWARYEFTVTTDSGLTDSGFLRITNSTSGATVWFDAIQVEKASSAASPEAQPYTPSAVVEIYGGQIEANTITASQIAANTITASEIAADTITATEIAASTITATEMNISQLSAIAADMGSLTAGSIVIGSTNKLWLNDAADGGLAIGGSTKASAPFRVTSAGALTATNATITGSITSTSGTIGGWSIASAELSSGSVKIQSTAERILLGAATDPTTGIGVFLGKDGTDYEFRAGNPAGNRMHWDGTNLTVNGATISDPTITGIQSGSEIAIQGWQYDGAFSASDADTVAWASGTLRLMNGVTYSITGSNTGNMAARTYIYFDVAVSTTAFQVTTTAATAVGSGKILIAVAENSTGEALFQVFGGIGGLMVDGDTQIRTGSIVAGSIATNTITANEIAANTITASEIAAGTITATEITGTTLSAIYADMGTLTAGTIKLIDPATNWNSWADPDTVTGLVLGYDPVDTVGKLAGYNAGVAQVYIDSDGKMYAGNGKVILDADGISILEGSATTNKIIWINSGGYTFGEINTELTASDAEMYIYATNSTGVPTITDAKVTIEAHDQGTPVYASTIILDTVSGILLESTGYIKAMTQLWVNTGNPSEIPFYIKGAASQTANLQEWQDSSGNALTVVDASGNVGIGTASPDTLIHGVLVDNVSVAVSNVLTLGHNRTPGVTGNGFGGAINMQLETSTTNDRNAARIAWLWGTATDASRKALMKFYVSDSSGENEALRLEALGGSVGLYIYGNLNANSHKISSLAAATAAGEALSYNQSGWWLGSGTLSGNLNANSYKVTSLATASASGDAISYGQAGASLVGLTLTDDLIMNSHDVIGAAAITSSTLTTTGVVSIGTNLTIGGALDHNGSTVGFFGTTPATQSTGWTITNLTTDHTLDCDSTTLAEVADVLGTLINQFKLYGLLG